MYAMAGDEIYRKVCTFVITGDKEFTMIKEITLRAYGGSPGTTLPKAMTDRLNLSAGDKDYAVETEQGIAIRRPIRRAVRAASVHRENLDHA